MPDAALMTCPFVTVCSTPAAKPAEKGKATKKPAGRLGGRLRTVRGAPVETMVVAAAGADSVYWNADVTPYATTRDAAVAESLGDRAVVHEGRWIHPPGSAWA